MVGRSRVGLGLALLIAGGSCSAATPGSFAATHIRDLDARGQLSLQDIVETADLSGVSISPNKKLVAVRVDKPLTTENRVASTWYIVHLDGKPPKRIADGGNPVWDVFGPTQQVPVWSHDSRSIYFRALQGEEVAIWRSYIDGRSEKLSHDSSNIDRFVLDDKHARIFYSAAASRGAIRRAEAEQYRDGILLTPDVDVGASLQRNLPYLGRMTTLRRSMAGDLPLLANASTRNVVIDLTNGRSHAASVAEKKAFVTLTNVSNSILLRGVEAVSWSDNHNLAVVVDGVPSSSGRLGAPDPTRRLRLVDLIDQTKTESCTKPECTFSHERRLALESVTWRPRSSEVLFIVELPSGGTSLYAWNTATNIVRQVFSSPGLIGGTSGTSGTGRFHPIGCPAAYEVAICTLATADGPPQLISINLTSGAIHTLLDPNLTLRHKIVAKTSSVAWRDRWGRPVTGILVLPTAARPARLPLVITSYRCSGFLRGGGAANVPEHVLAQYGIAALCINANTYLDGAPYPSGRVPRGQAANLQTTLDAWEAGANYLVARGTVDPTRIGISGFSFTGEEVQYALTHSNAFSVGGANQGSFTDPFAYYFSRGTLGAFLHKIYGVPEPTQDIQGVYKFVSPAINAHRMNSALLIQTDENEFRTSLQYFYALETLRKRLEVYVFPDEGHQFWQPIHRLVMNERFIDWFRFWLQGHEDPDPKKRSQYQRWERLRR
jgi:dipeptidyl aminopeptidase/acylaminoacyl peptidase